MAANAAGIDTTVEAIFPTLGAGLWPGREWQELHVEKSWGRSLQIPA